MIARWLAATFKVNGDPKADIPSQTAGNLLQNGLNIVWFTLGFVAVIMIILGGYQFLTSNGDPQKASKARQTLLYSVVGLVAAALAFAITNFVIGQL
jgi:glucose uptake protein GlcU